MGKLPKYAELDARHITTIYAWFCPKCEYVTDSAWAEEGGKPECEYCFTPMKNVQTIVLREK